MENIIKFPSGNSRVSNEFTRRDLNSTILDLQRYKDR